jgi:hypothetical protein
MQLSTTDSRKGQAVKRFYTRPNITSASSKNPSVPWNFKVPCKALSAQNEAVIPY